MIKECEDRDEDEGGGGVRKCDYRANEINRERLEGPGG